MRQGQGVHKVLKALGGSLEHALELTHLSASEGVYPPAANHH